MKPGKQGRQRRWMLKHAPVLVINSKAVKSVQYIRNWLPKEYRTKPTEPFSMEIECVMAGLSRR